MTKEESYFIRVDDPEMVRLSILESSKLLLHSQQAYYQLLTVRKRKAKAIERLKLQTKELSLLLSKVEGFLPFQDVVASSAKKTKGKSRSTIANAEKEIVNTESITSISELDKLNRSLSMIEEKLSKLN